MGKVFSFEQIETGQLPKLAYFDHIKNKIIRGLKLCEQVIGAIICGSVNRGDYNLRSDFDCLVLLEGERQDNAIFVLQQLSAQAKQRFVPVEFIPVDIRLAKTPMHAVEYTFSLHLEWSARQGGVIKENPLKYLLFNESVQEGELAQYLKNKHRMFLKNWAKLPSLSEEQHLHFLQKILEAPVYIGRKILRWSGVDISFDDSKKSIERLYMDAFAEEEISRLFKEVIAVDNSYTEELDAQILKPNRRRHEAVIQKIEKMIPSVLEYIRLTIGMIRR